MKAILTFLVLIFAVPAQADGTAELPAAAPLFDATLWDADDRPFAMAALRGRPLVVNFWARWCGPCRVEIPELAKVHRKLKDKGLVVVGIGLEDKAASVREFAQAYEMDYTVLLAKERGISLLQALGNAKAGLPYTLVIDAQGRVVARKLGLMTRSELEAAVERLF